MARPNRISFDDRLPPSTPFVLIEDPHRALYRREKARRAERANPKLDAAKAEFSAHLEREKQARKSGRPKGPSFGRKQSRPVDLSESLEPFGVAS